MHSCKKGNEKHEAAVKSKIMQIAARNREFGWFCMLQININLIPYLRLYGSSRIHSAIFQRISLFLRKD